MEAKKILIVEDETMTVEILKAIFKKDNYTIAVAKDGVEAIDLIPIFLPDLILTTMLLPLKSGFEVIRFTKETFPEIAIVALSILGEEENTVVEAFKLGVDDFIAKPFNPQELHMRIKRLL